MHKPKHWDGVTSTTALTTMEGSTRICCRVMVGSRGGSLGKRRGDVGKQEMPNRMSGQR